MMKIIELIKTLIIVVLSLSMLYLWISYIDLQFDQSQRDTHEATIDRNFWIFTDETRSLSDVVADEEYFLPSSVSLVLSGKGYTSAYNEELTSTLYSSYSPLITEIFSSAYICKKENLNVWEKALLSEDAILIEYCAPLPYSTIALFSGRKDNYCLGQMCFVKALLLFSDDSNNLTALSLDSDSNVFSYKWENEDTHGMIYDFNSNNLAAYTVNKGFIDFDFNQNSSKTRTSKKLPSEYKMLTSVPKLDTIKVENPLTDLLNNVFASEDDTYLTLLKEEKIAELIDIFEINPNVMGYYSDSESGIFMVGHDISLIVSPQGTVEYSATDASTLPITVSELLGTARTDFTSDEILAAATAFINEFPDGFITNGAKLILKGTRYSPEKDEMMFDFGYYYQLCEIVGQNLNCGVSLTFNSKGLVKAVITPISAEKTSDNNSSSIEHLGVSITPSVAIKLIDEEKVDDLAPVYFVSDYKTSVLPAWAAKTKAGRVNL
ncbi:MAG: hypothetical protein E7582_07230 [Ruminococcaceae bacterium]|nr:hypothetical protein [Oscillospiraceae bacterium]